MKKKDMHLPRRRFIQVTLTGLAAAHAGLAPRLVAGAQLPRLEESDATAKALAYVHDATTVTEQVRGGNGRVCSTCRFFGKVDEGWGPCTLFPGKSVAAPGWCKGWVAKA